MCVVVMCEGPSETPADLTHDSSLHNHSEREHLYALSLSERYGGVCQYISTGSRQRLIQISDPTEFVKILNKQTQKFAHYLHSDNGNSITSNNVGAIYEDANKNLWIGTMNGLSCFNKKTNKFINYSTSDGLPGNNIFGILGDKNNNNSQL